MLLLANGEAKYFFWKGWTRFRAARPAGKSPASMEAAAALFGRCHHARFHPTARPQQSAQISESLEQPIQRVFCGEETCATSRFEIGIEIAMASPPSNNRAQ